jgi:hypothetical protein
MAGRATPALLLLAIAITVPGNPVFAQFESRPIPGTSCPAFPADSWWHADVSRLPKHARSAQWMQRMSSGRNLHPDFGPSYSEQPAPYGIPITIVRRIARQSAGAISVCE